MGKGLHGVGSPVVEEPGGAGSECWCSGWGSQRGQLEEVAKGRACAEDAGLGLGGKGEPWEVLEEK